jgi:hypothetical protein
MTTRSAACADRKCLSCYEYDTNRRPFLPPCQCACHEPESLLHIIVEAQRS